MASHREGSVLFLIGGGSKPPPYLNAVIVFGICIQRGCFDMKHISPKILRKRRVIAWLVWSASVVMALLLVFSPELFPPPSYDELYEKTVTVSSCERTHQYRGGYSYRLYTEEDSTFTLTGTFDHDTVADMLQHGVTATVKGYPSINPFFDCAEEITVNGEAIVSYNNDDPPDRIALVWLGLFFVLIGTGYTACSLWWAKHLQSLEEKRNKRIEKKYGKT